MMISKRTTSRYVDLRMVRYLTSNRSMAGTIGGILYRILWILVSYGMLWFVALFVGWDPDEYPRPYADLCVWSLLPLVMMIPAMLIRGKSMETHVRLIVFVITLSISCLIYFLKLFNVVRNGSSDIVTFINILKLTYDVAIFSIGLIVASLCLSKNFRCGIAIVFAWIFVVTGYFAIVLIQSVWPAMSISTRLI